MTSSACGIGSRPAPGASYGRRKRTVEPAFGIAGMRFRQFRLAQA